MSIKENILYMLFLPVIVTALMGGCQTKDYIREARCLRKHPIKEGYVKIDSISGFTSASSTKTLYSGHGYVVGEKIYGNQFPLSDLARGQKKGRIIGESIWKKMTI